MRRILVAAMFAALALTGLPAAGAQVGDRFRARLVPDRSQMPVPGRRDMAYGGDPLQHLDFWPATKATATAPLVVFVHGGGWKRGDKDNATGPTKIAHFLGEGYAVASIDYRLVPANTVEDEAHDVAKAVAFLLGRAKTLGVDPRRVVLMGHSAGAHLAALVGTDPRYLAEAGLKPDAVAGVVLLDGAAYDVPRQIADGGNFMHGTYLQAFGSDPARQRALSPTMWADAPNAPRFLILHIDRDDGTVQSEALGAALRKAGTPAQVKGVGGTGLMGHMAINRDLGKPDYPATPLVDAFLAEVFAG
jgi:acetyl esterase/lipase